MATGRKITEEEKFTPVRGKSIVIVGGGLMGLTNAIRLVQLGVAPENITIVESHDDDIRSGDISGKVFEEISAAIHPLQITPSHMRHIKDVGRQLREHAKSLNIKIIKNKFIGFGENSQIKLENGPQIRADIVFDATGAKRAVVKESKEDGFVEEIVSEDPSNHSHYALIHVFMNLADILRLQDAQESLKNYSYKEDPIRYALTMEKLRKELKWDKQVLPFFYMNVSRKYKPLMKTKDMKTPVKSNFYTQVSKNLTDQEVFKFIQIFAEFAGIEEITLHRESRKHPNKKVINTFEVVPKVVRKACHISKDKNKPTKIIIGDANINEQFLIGYSCRDGLVRMKHMHIAFYIDNGEIKGIYLEKLEKTFAEDLNEAISRINEQFAYHKSFVIKGEAIHENLFREALTDALKKSQLLFNEIADEKTGFKINNPFVLKKLKQSMDYLMTAFGLDKKENKSLQTYSEKMADHLKKYGSYYFKQDKFDTAKKYYKQSLDLYNNIQAPHFNEKLTLYSNLMIILVKEKKYSQVIELAASLEVEVIPFVDKGSNQSVLDKIVFNVAVARLNEAEKLTAKEDQLKLADEFSKIEKLIPQLSKNSETYAKNLQRQLLTLKQQAEKRSLKL